MSKQEEESEDSFLKSRPTVVIPGSWSESTTAIPGSWRDATTVPALGVPPSRQYRRVNLIEDPPLPIRELMKAAGEDPDGV